MDQEKKQKVILGVVAALIIGAGGIWYTTRDSGTTETQAVQKDSGPKKRRGADVAATKKVGKKKRTAATVKKTASVQKTREVKERKTKEKRKRKVGKKKKKKKKIDAPAA